MKKLTYALVVFTSILFLGLTFSYNPLMANPTDELDEEKEVYLNILVVNKELYKMTEELVGSKHNVEYLFSNDKEVKEFIVNENIINNISNMDLFIYNGAGYEPWINKVIDNVKNSNVGLINASRGIRLITNELTEETNENPYYLLGFNEYKIALYNIKTALQERDIKNRGYYEENYNNIVKNLDEFLSKEKEELSSYENYSITTNTDKFDYLFRSIGIQVNKLKDNIDEVNENRVEKNIFIYDKDNENLEDIKNNMKNEYIYIGLGSDEDDNILTKNLSEIVDVIKNKSNY
ncbi:zinc ABC transporter substrate-binding protein [Clostridium sp. Sa3CUN1]|uniref:Zinc ABC transporter substrate-binding protein n=1 Tax=Clostridium gallinarum TaxID=2762246 RepID=A0ABR8Q5C3_9CLOT|nr:zinc ABC transporter substrate-binding protein [Clostridium gallinarum]MBD7915614.1 zinc ABC transporter substrate-binding protein [Clostridium gallinarum]